MVNSAHPSVIIICEMYVSACQNDTPYVDGKGLVEEPLNE